MKHHFLHPGGKQQSLFLVETLVPESMAAPDAAIRMPALDHISCAHAPCRPSATASQGSPNPSTAQSRVGMAQIEELQPGCDGQGGRLVETLSVLSSCQYLMSLQGSEAIYFGMCFLYTNSPRTHLWGYHRERSRRAPLGS